MNAPIEFEQTDARWRDVMYSNHGDTGQTIGKEGCGPTCAAMVVATLRPKAGVTPKEAADWSVKHGYQSYDDGTYWAYFAAYMAWYGIPCRRTDSPEEAIAALRQNYMVISAMGTGMWTSGGHFILAYGITGSKVKIHDPNSEASYRELGELARYCAEAKQYWIIPEDWKVETKIITVKDLTRAKNVQVTAVNIGGNNYVKLRDLERLAPILVGNEGATPTVRINYKE